MPNHYDEIDYEDYQLSQEARNQNLLAGIGTGAASGAAVGSAFSPIGTVIGGVVGGVGGAIAGSVQSGREQTALKEAYERDLEIQRRLAEVDHLDPFVASAGLLQGNVEQEAEMSARQAAARGGLSEAAAQEFAQAGRQRAALGRSTAIAAAVPAAAQADIMERQRIIAEETGRQDLFDRATQGPDAIAQFGAFGGAAAAVAGQATAAGGPLGPAAAGGASAAQRAPSAGGTYAAGMAQAGRSAAGDMTAELNAIDEPSTLLGRMRGRGTNAASRYNSGEAFFSDSAAIDAAPPVVQGQLTPDDMLLAADYTPVTEGGLRKHGLGTGAAPPVVQGQLTPDDMLLAADYTPSTEGGLQKHGLGDAVQFLDPVTGQIETSSVDAIVKQDPDLEPFVASGNAQMIAGQQNAIVAESRSPSNILAGKPPQDIKRDFELANETIALDLQSGRVSQLEFEEILATNPNAVTDPVSWGNAVANYRMQNRPDLNVYDNAYDLSGGYQNFRYSDESAPLTLSNSTIDALLR